VILDEENAKGWIQGGWDEIKTRERKLRGLVYRQPSRGLVTKDFERRTAQET
jgi:hypothetical protein